MRQDTLQRGNTESHDILKGIKKIITSKEAIGIASLILTGISGYFTGIYVQKAAFNGQLISDALKSDSINTKQTSLSMILDTNLISDKKLTNRICGYLNTNRPLGWIFLGNFKNGNWSNPTFRNPRITDPRKNSSLVEKGDIIQIIRPINLRDTAPKSDGDLGDLTKRVSKDTTVKVYDITENQKHAFVEVLTLPKQCLYSAFR